eukprot:1072315-Prorocentrum_lima.AAC.1
MQHTSRTRASIRLTSVIGGFQCQKAAQTLAMKAHIRAPGRTNIGYVLVVGPSILQAATIRIGC